jgi:hypothetical protein
VSWDQRFAEPIVLDDGSKVLTLREAIAHLGKIIPKSENDMKEVQAAARCLTQAAEHGGPVKKCGDVWNRCFDLGQLNRRGRLGTRIVRSGSFTSF